MDTCHIFTATATSPSLLHQISHSWDFWPGADKGPSVPGRGGWGWGGAGKEEAKAEAPPSRSRFWVCPGKALGGRRTSLSWFWDPPDCGWSWNLAWGWTSERVRDSAGDSHQTAFGRAQDLLPWFPKHLLLFSFKTKRENPLLRL